MSWGEKIRDLRLAKNLTQKQVADAIGVTDQTVSNWELKTYEPRLTLKQARDLCKILQCTLDELIAATYDDPE